MKTVISQVLLLFFSSGFLSAAMANGLEQVGESGSLSELIRSNGPHYWTYAKSVANQSEFAPFIKFQGVVAGDPHLGNFSVTRVYTQSREPRMQYLNIDLDDAGRGPFFFDFARLVVTIESINNKVIKKSDLEQAYIDGLDGRTLAPPKIIQDALGLSVDEYEGRVQSYVNKKTKQDKFKLSAGELEAYTGDVSKKLVELARPGIRVLDLARRVEQRGGSLGQIRIWALVENNSGQRRILELKAWAETSLAKYQHQEAPSLWLKSAHEVFWSGLDSSQYDLIDLKRAGLFWIREKKVGLIDIPYTSQDADALEFIRGASLFAANTLGRWHGQQMSARGYWAALRANRPAFHMGLDGFVKSYLDVVRKEARK